MKMRENKEPILMHMMTSKRDMEIYRIAQMQLGTIESPHQSGGATLSNACFAKSLKTNWIAV